MGSFPVNCEPVTARPLAYFAPSLWGDSFCSLHQDNELSEEYGREIKELKEEVRGMLVVVAGKPKERMNLINTIERLGVSHHFEKEIEELLEQTFHTNSKLEEDDDDDEDYDLFTVALYFRVFRQHGYNISCDVFNKFKDSDGKFKEGLTSDVMGMLSLYEAAHLRIHGEDVLDEALAFTTTHLESMVTELEPFLAKQVMHALEQSLHRGIPRIEARHYISVYQEDASKNELLLKFAKLDFNLLQMMHRQELYHISRWWKDLDLITDLSYARDRVVECYFWAMATYFEPQYSLARINLAKIFAMSSVLDDTYDAYGTLDELKPFTDAIQRWDMSAIDQLPDYMKILFRAILNFYEEFEKEMTKQGRIYSVQASKDAFKELAWNYYIEAKWCDEAYVPPFDECMDNALITAGYYFLTTASFMGMGEIATAEVFDWTKDKPKMLVAASTIARLMDNIVDHEEEEKRKHAATGIECYMKQYGVSKKEVIEEFYKRIESAWKDMNEEILKPNSISMHLLMRVVNLTRAMDVLYKHEDAYTHPEKVLKDYIVSVFIDPIPV